ncbi:MAG TPA: hypothetical protein VEK79_07100 [Thermoanaerobaculia bacterium]|nr:hypothetical protein [Thermoanaerobaculia bacterium]
MISEASAGTNAQAGWTLNLATDTSLYNIGALGNQVQAWAFAQGVMNGQLRSQYSTTQNYTVSP